MHKITISIPGHDVVKQESVGGVVGCGWGGGKGARTLSARGGYHTVSGWSVHVLEQGAVCFLLIRESGGKGRQAEQAPHSSVVQLLTVLESYVSER